MNQAFSVAELEVLCADVEQAMRKDGIREQVNLDIVGDGTKTLKVLKLIQHLDRRGYLKYLIDAVRATRPGII